MKPLQYVLLFSFFFLIFSMHFTSSADMSQDLGRHIRIGEIIVQQKYIPNTNLFSYTNPAFPFINHHWLSEILFYTTASIVGLPLLIIIKVIVFILAIGVLVSLGYRLKHPLITIGTALLFLLLFMERSNIRPEMFGYLLFSLMLYVFFLYPVRGKLFRMLPFIMLIWINLHISFIFGIVILGLLFLKMVLIMYKESKGSKLHISKDMLRDIYIIIGSGLITIINPHGIYGLLYPLNIFNNYGYTIVENQNIFFLNSIMVNLHIRYLFLLSPIIAVSIFILLFNKKFLETLLLLLFSTAVMMQIRHMPFFALTAIPTVSLSFSLVLKKIKVREKHIVLTSALLSVFCIGLSIFFLENIYFQTFDLQKTFGMDMTEEGRDAADFVLSKQLPGRMFNNFDIGGYTIYKLYPTYKVFVDNRPEAYSRDFLQNVYIKLQIDHNTRKQIFKQYDIQTVFFAHTDQTYWANAFIEDITTDPEWRLVYLDDAMLVMTKDTNQIDIRTDEKKLTGIIKNQSNYISLLKLVHIFGLLKQDELADQAFTKAAEINPLSCAINKSLYHQYAASQQLQKAIDIKSNFWYCF